MNGIGPEPDETLEALAFLPLHEPDRARAAKVQARCHAVLRQRRQQPELPARSAWPSWGRRLEPALVGALCAVYLVEVLARAVRLYRF